MSWDDDDALDPGGLNLRIMELIWKLELQHFMTTGIRQKTIDELAELLEQRAVLNGRKR